MSEQEQTAGQIAAPSDTPAEPNRVTLLEQGLWRQLTAMTDTPTTAKSWAPLMFEMLDDAEVCCVFLTDPESGRLLTVANWPEARIPGGTLLSAAQAAAEADRGIVRGAIDKGEAREGELVSVATPISAGGKVTGAVGIELRPRNQAALRSAMRRLQWGAAWMRDALRRDASARQAASYEQAKHALNAVVGVAEQEDFPTAARAAATDMAGRFDCERVAIGFRRLGKSRVAAISNSAQFGKQMNLVRLLGAAMDEAIDQKGVVIYPPEAADEPMAAHRHEKLARAQASGQILTAPLYAVDRFVGAIVFERPEDKPFTQDEAEILEAVATVIAPVLDEKRRNDRWLIVKAADVVRAQFMRLVGPGRLARKAVVLAFAALVAFFWFATGTDRVSANAVVEGRIQRAITAPFDGFIAQAAVRAGDTVADGALLVRLDDRELTLERLRLVTELQRQRIEYDRALAQGDRAQTSIRRSQIEQSEAQIALIDKQLERTALTAPFEGLVVAGDLSQSIGGAVARGETLLTIAPAGDYRITLQVDERRISDVETGQTGQLIVTALPEQNFALEVAKITPVAEYGDGVTTFRVEARLAAEAGPLQPGMEGVAKIDIDEKRLFTIWTRPMANWFKLWSWRWLGLD